VTAGSVDRFAAVQGRLDAIVAARLGISRADAQRAVEEGRVLVEGEARPKSFRLAGGERVEIRTAGAEELPAEGPPIPIRYEDEHLLVIAKPAGMVTHPTTRRRGGTLVNSLLDMGVPLAPAGGPLRPGIVHRLDAGTSGLMIVAKEDATHAALSAMLRRHEVDRRYLALVRGRVKHHRFAVEAPLGRSGARVRVRPVTGREAETEFEVRERFERATLLVGAPRTGRTHQIRVHLSSVGHPILGDRAYGGGGDDAKRLGLTGPFLHSWRLTFEHPITRERIEREEPLPEDLSKALRRAGGMG